MSEKEFIDKFELYSFTTYLYIYGFFYLFVFEQTFFKGLLINIIFNLFSHNLINYNIIYFLQHKYWKKNLSNIAMPQLITCATNVTLCTTINKNNSYIVIPINIIQYYLLKNTYKDEIIYSKNLRFIINIIFFIYYHFF